MVGTPGKMVGRSRWIVRSTSPTSKRAFKISVAPSEMGTFSAAVEMRNLSAASERLVANGVAATSQTNLERVLTLQYFDDVWSVMTRFQDFENLDEAMK